MRAKTTTSKTNQTIENNSSSEKKKSTQTRLVQLERGHYENLPDPSSIYDLIEPQESSFTKSRFILQLQLIWIANKVAGSHHRDNAVRSWGHSISYMHCKGQPMESIGAQFGVSRKKIHSHRKIFLELARPHLEQASKITTKRVDDFIDTLKGAKDFPSETFMSFVSDIEQVFRILVYAPESRSGKHEVAVDIFSPSNRRRELLQRYGCPASAANRVAAFFEFIN